MAIIADTGRQTVSIVTWEDIRSEFKKVNPSLAAIIDEISPSKDYKFVLAEYSFGDIYVKNGVAQFCTNNANSPLSINHPLISEKIKKELYYNTMPLFLILNKDSEVFIDTGSRIIPLNLFHQGNLSGVYESMDFLMKIPSKPIWNFSAGSRTIITLPKITDRSGLKKLHAEFDIPSTVQVDTLTDHWQLFKLIAQSKNFKQEWKNKILFFNHKWLTTDSNSLGWKKFRSYLLGNVWFQVQYVIDKVKFNLGFEKYFDETLAFRRLHPAPYLINQVIHLLSTAAGNFPAFKVIDNSQESAPKLELQKLLNEVYGLKKYMPTMMCVYPSIDCTPESPYFYSSLSFPTMIEGTSLKKNSSTIISDMKETKLLIDNLKKYSKRNFNLEEESIIKETQFDYFHHEKDSVGSIKSSAEIFNEDADFFIDQKNFLNREPCMTSPFFRGCIRIKACRKNK